MIIELPWPPKELRPNANSPGNWRRKSEAAKKYKSSCFYLAKAKPVPKIEHWTALEIFFHPPDNKRRDLDNMLAQIKAALDGISQAWGINDRLFRPITIDFATPVKYGKVVIAIETV